MSARGYAKLKKAAATAFTILLGILVVFPVLYGALGAFKTEGEFYAYPPTVFPKNFQLGNFAKVIEQVPMARYFLNSSIIAFGGAFIRVLIAVLAAYAFAYYDFKGKKFLFFVFLGTMMLPADTLLITNYQTVSTLGLMDTYLGVMIVSFVGATQMFMLRQSFMQAPLSQREAAQLDGCGEMRFLAGILVPSVKPVLVILYTQSFISLWNSYLWPLLITNHNDMRTVQVGVTMLTTVEDTNYHLVLAGVALALIPALLVFFLLRRQIARSLQDGVTLT